MSVLNFRRLLRGAFTQAELDYLTSHPEFSTALERTHTLSKYPKLCALGERLLNERKGRGTPGRAGVPGLHALVLLPALMETVCFF